ncbi:MAG: hypothetical protein ACRDZ8_15050 [Acidimicrobiales bacterium]
MTPPTLPGADDVLRFAFSQGPGRDFVATLGPPERPLTTSFGLLPAGARTDRVHPLVSGSVDLLEATPYPAICNDKGLTVTERWQHAAVMAFGLQRREPANLFNDHRSSASVRSRFPVHPFVQTDDDAWYLDVYRHGLLPLGEAPAEVPDEGRLRLALAGRYTHLPSLYGRLRGPLVELELGIGLRNLWVALEVFGLRGRLWLPGAVAHKPGPLEAALYPPGEWTSVLTIEFDDAAAHGSAGPAPRRRPARGEAPPRDPFPTWCAPARGYDPTGERGEGTPRFDDPTLDEAAAVHRSALATASHWGAGTAGGAQGVPASLTPSILSWGEVLWRRSAGHMPRQLPGFSGRRRPLSKTAVDDAAAWVSARPPTLLLATVAEQIQISVCLQDVAGYRTGWYRLRNEGPDGGPELELRRADPSLPAYLEACYGHRLSPQAGCAVRHAAMTWVLSADVASLIERFGPGGWTLAQYACGWMVHGLCLSAAVHGCYARPTRAFDEVLLHPVVGTAPGEMVLLSVVMGTGRFVEPALDLRT